VSRHARAASRTAACTACRSTFSSLRYAPHGGSLPIARSRRSPHSPCIAALPHEANYDSLKVAKCVCAGSPCCWCRDFPARIARSRRSPHSPCFPALTARSRRSPHSPCITALRHEANCGSLKVAKCLCAGSPCCWCRAFPALVARSRRSPTNVFGFANVIEKLPVTPKPSVVEQNGRTNRLSSGLILFDAHPCAKFQANPSKGLGFTNGLSLFWLLAIGNARNR